MNKVEKTDLFRLQQRLAKLRDDARDQEEQAANEEDRQLARGKLQAFRVILNELNRFIDCHL